MSKFVITDTRLCHLQHLVVLIASCATGKAPAPDAETTGGISTALTAPATGGTRASSTVTATGGIQATGGILAAGGTTTTGGITAALPRDAASPDAHDWTHCPEAVVTSDDTSWILANTGKGTVFADWSTLPYDHIKAQGCPTGLDPASNGGQASLLRNCMPAGAATLVLTIHCRDPGQQNDRAIEVRKYPVGA